jgi:DNA anti-recombination protein RmuC
MPELGNLTEFISEVEQLASTCQTKNEEISDLTSDLNKCEDDIEKAIVDIREDAQKFTTDFETEHAESLSGLDTFIALLEKLAGEGIGDFLKTFEDIDEATDKACEAGRNELDGSFKELENDGFKELEKGIDDCEQIVSDQENETKQSFEQYEAHTEEQKTITSAFKDATVGIFGTVVENLTDTLTSEVGSSFDSFTSGLTSNLGEIAQNISDVGGALTQGFDMFNKGADDLGNMLTTAVGEVFTNTMSHMTDSLMSHLEQIFANLCEQVFQGLMQEFVEQLVVMGIGQAVTTATAQFAPVIIAAKIVLGIIEKLLSLIGM